MGTHSLPDDSRLERKAVAVVLAGGRGTRLGALTRYECKPALPFGCRFRTIDFSLSNCANSGIRQVGIATEYAPASLRRHIASAWVLLHHRCGCSVAEWPAKQAGIDKHYRGTADAVYRNWGRIRRTGARCVLILAGDHVYKMDYRPMLAHHVSCGADMTVACIEVGLDDAPMFGIMSVDRSDRVTRFTEKPRRPEVLPGRPHRALASMGVYVFNTVYLAHVLEADACAETSTHDFGRDIIPAEIDRARVFAYRFDGRAEIGRGYWRDIGTPGSYWQAHMDLLRQPPGLDLDDDAWPLWGGPRCAHAGDRPPAAEGVTGELTGSVIGRGCRIRDVVIHRSAVCWDVAIGSGTRISSSLVLPGARIGRVCRIDHAIVASGCRIPDGATIDGARNDDPAGAPTPIVVTQDLFTQDMTAFAASSRPLRHPRYLPRAAAAQDAARTALGR